MPNRRIGGVRVSAVGLGAMLMSLAGRPDEARSLRTIHAALGAGITLIDTADAYCLGESEVGHNERLVAKALASWPGDRDGVLVATKGGHTRPGREWGLDGRPEYLRQACEASLRALGVEAIGLYQFHRPDPKVPFAESVGALAELQAAGKVRMVGLSNVSVDQIEQARRIVEVVSVQNELSPRFRRSEGELAWCAAHGVAFLPWSPLGGMGRGGMLGQRHRAFAEVAGRHGVSPQRVALAWELAKAPVVIPIPGARRPETIADSAAAATLRLDDDELDRLDAL
ncbi:MAG TPA: aldo/keto reductase [Actinomycetota bacterium]|nr:aldo/keto reductase [Actinomycetota bacterium]